MNFYSGCVRRGLHSAVVFISPAILPALNTATVLLVDATFKVVPRNPSELVQLMTISAVAFDKVGMIAMSERTFRYVSVFSGFYCCLRPHDEQGIKDMLCNKDM